MSKYAIKSGDIVTVNFYNSQCTLGRELVVMHIPNVPGDWWIFKDNEIDKLHYVSEGCTVTKDTL
jgi:hypothetical protein